jgi:hypothetical protein
MRLCLALATAATVALGLAAAPAGAGRGANLVRYLPDDTHAVLVTDVARARRAKMLAKGLALARDRDDWLDALASALPLDKLVDTVVFAATPGKAYVVILEGKVDKLIAQARKDHTRVEVHAGVTYWVTAGGEVAMIDKKLVFATAGVMPGVIDRAKDKKARGPAAARTILAAVPAGTDAFGGVVVEGARRTELAKALGADPELVAVGVKLSSSLGLELRAQLTDEQAATKVATEVAGQLTEVTRGKLEVLIGKAFSESLTVGLDGRALRVSATLTGDEIDRVVAYVKMLM